MAKEKISELTAAGALTGAELVPVVQGGETVQTTAQDIADLGGGGGASYLVYVALLSQSGTDAPVATVLENTLGGAVVWTREGGGEYVGTLASAFTENKTWFQYPNTSINMQSQGMQWLSENTVGLNYNTDYDGIAYVEIRVYP